MAVLGARAGKFGDTGVPKHKHLFRKQVARIAPDLKTEQLHGAVRYYDCQVDDARLVMTIARTASSHGAHVATRTKVVGFLREGERVVGVRAVDLETGRELEIRARVVVNAAGVWTDDIQEMVGGRGSLNVQASKGIHLVVPRDRIRSECGFITKTETSVLFVIPWGRHWIIGTTDTAVEPRQGAPRGQQGRHRLPAPAREHDPARAAWTTRTSRACTPGCGPLARGESEPTSRISREHTVVAPVPGLVMIAGGKLTTYRVMARDAVDAAARSLTGAGHAAVRDSITDRVPLVGAPGFEARTNQRVLLARRIDLHISRIDHLLERYGSLVDELLALIGRRPELGQPLEGADDYLAAEVVYAVTHEGARHLDDVLTRRTRISVETVRPRRRQRRPGRRADGDGARLGRHPHRRRGRPLPAPGRGRAAEPAQADRPGGRRGARQRAGDRLRVLGGVVSTDRSLRSLLDHR